MAIIFLIVATLSVYFMSVNFTRVADEWAKVAQNINQTFEDFKPHDIDTPL